MRVKRVKGVKTLIKYVEKVNKPRVILGFKISLGACPRRVDKRVKRVKMYKKYGEYK